MQSNGGILVVMLAAALSSACAQTERAPARTFMPDDQTLRYRQCAQDDDCVQVTDGCCDCSQDGRVIAVARGQEAAFRATIVCGGELCHEMWGGCNVGDVRCEAGICQFHPGHRDVPK